MLVEQKLLRLRTPSFKNFVLKEQTKFNIILADIYKQSWLFESFSVLFLNDQLKATLRPLYPKLILFIEYNGDFIAIQLQSFITCLKKIGIENSFEQTMARHSMTLYFLDFFNHNQIASSFKPGQIEQIDTFQILCIKIYQRMKHDSSCKKPVKH